MDVFDLFAKLELDTSGYEKNVGNAKTSFSNLGSSIASGAKTIGKVGVAAFAAIGTAIGGATTALVKNAGETAAYADNIDKMSQKMGISAEAYQEWDFILQHSGSSIDAMSRGMQTLQKNAVNSAEKFEALGLTQEQVASMSTEELFEATIKGLQGMEEGAERTALASELLGGSAKELGALLNTSAEDTEAMKQQVHDLGGVMSDEAVKAGAAFQDSLQNLKTTLSGAKNALMGEFLPSLTTVMDGLTALFSGDESGIGKIKEGIEEFASKLNEKLPQVIQTVGSIANSLISALPALFETIASQLPSILEQAIPVVIDAVVGLADSVVKALPSLMSAIQKNIGKITSGLTKIMQSLGQIILKLTPTLLPMILKVGIQLVTELARGFSENASEVIQTIIELINMVVVELTNPETLMLLLDCGLQILTALVNGIADNLPLLLETCGTLITNILTFLVEAIPELVTSIGKNGAKIITEVLPQIILSASYALSNLLEDVISTLSGWIPDILSKAKEIFEKIGDGISDAWTWIKEKVSEIAGNILAWFTEKFLEIKDIGYNLLMGLWNGIQDAKDWVLSKVKGVGSDILDGLKSVFSIASPSKRTKWMGEMLMEGFGIGMEDEADDTFRKMQRTLDEGMNDLMLDPLALDTTSSVAVKSSMDRNNPIITAINRLSERMDNIEISVTAPIFIGTEQIDEQTVKSKKRVQLRSGGQVDV